DRRPVAAEREARAVRSAQLAIAHERKALARRAARARGDLHRAAVAADRETKAARADDGAVALQRPILVGAARARRGGNGRVVGGRAADAETLAPLHDGAGAAPDARHHITTPDPFVVEPAGIDGGAVGHHDARLLVMIRLREVTRLALHVRVPVLEVRIAAV